MPTLSRWFIKSGIIYFVASMILLMLLQLHQKGIFSAAWIPFLKPVFYHTLMVGWITQIIFGVSIWMFPRYSREKPRGSEPIGWLAFGCLNLGLVLRIVGEPMLGAQGGSFWSFTLVVASILFWLAGIFYIAIIWQRVKGKN